MDIDKDNVIKWSSLTRDPDYLVPHFPGASTINEYKSDLGECARALLFEERVARRLAHVWCFTVKQGGFPSPFAEYMTQKHGVDPVDWPNPWVDDAVEWAAQYEKSLDEQAGSPRDFAASVLNLDPEDDVT